MASTITHRGTTFNTTAGDKTVTATPAANDLIIVIAATSGIAGGTTAITDNQGGTYVQVDSDRSGFSTTGHLKAYVRTALIPSATSTIFTATQASSTGGGLSVISASGMSLTGTSAVRSSGGQSTGTATTTPAPVLSLTPLSANPIIAAVANAATVAGTVLVQRATYTEDFDNIYGSPATGLEVNHLASGETSATLTQGGASATAFASIAIELAYDSAPTVVLNTPAISGALSLIDDFNGSSQDTSKWGTYVQGGGATVAQTNGQLVITFPASSTSSTDGESSSAATYNLTGKSAQLQIVAVPSSGTHADAIFRIYTDASNYFQWIYEAGTLFAQRNNAGSSATVTSFSFSATTHKYWRIIESGGVVSWDTSSDGSTWTNQGTYTHGMTITAMKVGIFGICFQAETSPGTFTVDNFNVIDPNTVTTTTPELDFTGTDPDSDDIRYNIQLAEFDPNTGLLDSYSETNKSSESTLSNTFTKAGQSFLGLDGVLDSCKFYLAKNSLPTGSAVVAIYATTGTNGVDAVPTGAALATSDNFDVSTLSSSTFALSTFSFSGVNRITLVAGTVYFLSVEYTGTVSNNVRVGVDGTSPTHSGNYANFFSASWHPNSGIDVCFYVYGVPTILVDKVSGTDAGFADITNGADTDPFASTNQVGFTVQAGNALTNGTTYYWRVRGIDPTGSNAYGAWSIARSFIVSSSIPSFSSWSPQNISQPINSIDLIIT